MPLLIAHPLPPQYSMFNALFSNIIRSGCATYFSSGEWPRDFSAPSRDPPDRLRERDLRLSCERDRLDLQGHHIKQ